MPDDDTPKDDIESDETSKQLTESMKRIAGYIAEFQAKYRQLEEEQRRRRERGGSRDQGPDEAD
jgi:hypothetical protein